MNSIKQLRNFLFTSTLAVLLATVLTFSFGTADSWAATTSLTQLVHYPSLQLASMNRFEAMKKNVEGKTQEAVGNVTGNVKDKMAGRAKQVESNIQNTVQDMDQGMTPKGRIKAAQKNLDGKNEVGIGNVTSDPKDQFQGTVKQVESNVRNAVEDIKDTVKDAFN